MKVNKNWQKCSIFDFGCPSAEVRKKKFNTPVLVKLSDTVFRLGFITQDNLLEIDDKTLVSIYMPHSYNFSGNLFLIPKENVTILEGLSSTDVMKFIVSGGISNLSIKKA